jgi:hypothetical protein
MPEEWYTMMGALNIDWNKEQVYVIYENPEGPTFGGPPGNRWEIQDQVQGLTNFLATTELTDIKLIGHSEGAAAIITVLDNLAQTGGYIGGKNIGDELTAAITIDAPTVMGADSVVDGWDVDRYNKLPDRLTRGGMNVQLLDVWNEASIAHSTCTMPGWGEQNTYSYDSRPLWQRAFNWVFATNELDRVIGSMFWGYHNDPLTNSGVIERIGEALN